MKINFEYQMLLTIFATWVSYLLGGYDRGLEILLILVVLDYITGLMKAFFTKNLSSCIGFRGILKKICLFIVICVAVQIDRFINQPDTLRNLVAYAFICNEAISILENAAEMGIPIPDALKELLRKMKKKNTQNIQNIQITQNTQTNNRMGRKQCKIKTKR
jgi:toxin secretion/phage lysis holin